MFEPFTPLAGKNSGGIGLGLATVKRLVESYGGGVGVESTPGQGCLFWFRLPRASARPEPTKARLTARPTSQGGFSVH